MPPCTFLRRDRLTAGAGQTVFTYTFEIFNEADITVWQQTLPADPIELTITTNYTVQGVGGGAKTITLVAPATLNDILTLEGHDAVHARETTFSLAGPNRSADINREYDNLLFLAQELARDRCRSIRVSGEANTVGLVTILGAPLADAPIGWDPTGRIITNLTALGLGFLDTSGASADDLLFFDGADAVWGNPSSLRLDDDASLVFGSGNDIFQEYDSANDRLEWTDGVNLLAFLDVSVGNAGIFHVTEQFLMVMGTAALPGLGIFGERNTGIYSHFAGGLAVTLLGIETTRWNVDSFFPTTDSSRDLGRTGERWRQAFIDDLVLTASITVGANFNLVGGFNAARGSATIASGAIAYSAMYMELDTQASAATDELDNITGGADGDILIIKTLNSARGITVTEVGNIILGATTRVLNVRRDRLVLQRDTDDFWVELSYSDNN